MPSGRLRTIAFIALLGLASAPGAFPAVTVQAQSLAPQPMFVGQVAGTDAYIGFVTNGNQLTGYVCDGTDNTIADTFDGAASDAVDGVLGLTTESGLPLALNLDADALPTIISSGSGITGTLTTTDGVAHSFGAVPATSPGALWEDDETLADGTTASGGWVVFNDGSVRGSIQRGNANSSTSKTTGMSAGPGGSGATSAVAPSDSGTSGLDAGDANMFVRALQTPPPNDVIQVIIPPDTSGVISQLSLNIPRVSCNDPRAASLGLYCPPS